MSKTRSLETIILVSVLIVAFLGLWFIFTGGSMFGRAGESGVSVWVDVGEEEEVDGITISVESADRNNVEFSVDGVAASGSSYRVNYYFAEATVRPLTYSGTRDSVKFKVKLGVPVIEQAPEFELPAPPDPIKVQLGSGFKPASISIGKGWTVRFINNEAKNIILSIVSGGQVIVRRAIVSGKSLEHTFTKTGDYGASYRAVPFWGTTGYKMGITVEPSGTLAVQDGQFLASVCQVGTSGHTVCQVGQTQTAVCEVGAGGQATCQVGPAGATQAAVCQVGSNNQIVCQVGQQGVVVGTIAAEQKALRVSLTGAGFVPSNVKLNPGDKVAFFNPNEFGIKGVKIIKDGNVIKEFSVAAGKTHEFTFSKQGNYGASYRIGDSGFKMGITVGVPA